MTETTSSGGDSGSSLLDKLPMERLTEAAQSALSQLASKAIDAALERVDGMTGRLTDVAGNGGSGLMNALTGGGGDEDGDDDSEDGGGSGGFTGMLKSAKDKVSGALGFGGGDDDGDDDSEGDDDGSGGGGSAGGGRGSFKFMNILEHVDIGAPRRVVYDQWTQMGDFPSFMKKVESVDQESDEKVSWKAQVFWSHRTWDTTIREQIPDTHIIWTSSGAKGSADGHVSFHELGPNLTRVILNMEYYPQGFFEKTGNLWRAVGRRTRLEFKHFARHVHMDTLLDLENLEGWRGEIRDSEVVKTHEEAVEEEQQAQDDEDVDEYDPEEESDEDFADEDEFDDEGELDDEEVPEDEMSDEDLPEDEDSAEDEESGEEDSDEEDSASDDSAEEPEGDEAGQEESGEAEQQQPSRSSSRRRRRQPANA